MDTIGEILRKKRKELGLSQAQLAQMLGYSSRSTVNKIELGINSLPIDKAEHLSEILKTDILGMMGYCRVDNKSEAAIELINLINSMTKDELKNLLTYAKSLSKNA